MLESAPTPARPQSASRLVIWSGVAFLASCGLCLVTTLAEGSLNAYLSESSLGLAFALSAVALAASSVTVAVAVVRNPPDFFVRAGTPLRLALALVFVALLITAAWSSLFVVTALLFRVH
jgi:hypothetical protein